MKRNSRRQPGEAVFEGMNFVITGSVEHFANRKELQELIESKGGKVTGSVTAKTAYLINNDAASIRPRIKRQRNWGSHNLGGGVPANVVAQYLPALADAVRFLWNSANI